MIKDYTNYSFEQRSRDIAVYSKGAEKRIESALSKGCSISGARSIEADRIAKYRSASKFVRRKEVVIIGGIIGSQTMRPALTYVKERLNNDIYTDTPVNRFIGSKKDKINHALDFMLDTQGMCESVGAMTGAVIIPRLVSSAIMLVGGYNPSKSL